MHKKILSSIVMIITLLFSFNGYTEELAKEKGRFSVGVKIGHLGKGLDIAYDYSDTISFRSNINQDNGSLYSHNIGDVTYDIEPDDQTLGVMIDYYPMGGNSGIRASLGAYKHQGSFSLNALKANSNNTNIGGTPYNLSNTLLKGRTTFDVITPYAGLAITGPGKPWGITAEIGYFFRDISPEVKLSDTSNTISDTDLRTEEQAISDDFKHGVLFLGLGISYHF